MNPNYQDALSGDLLEKYKKLEELILAKRALAVAFSGGVDSTFLLAVAKKVLKDQVLAVTASAVFVPERELEEAKHFCESNGIRQLILRVDPLEEEAIRKNDPERCYYCKRRIFTEILKTAKENGFSSLAEGSNMDDRGDYRPGARAVKELSVESPLLEAGLYKQEIRRISKAMGLPTWDKPAYACLASRFVYGDEITEEQLKMVEAAENFLIDLGFREERVRIHGDLARIEVPPTDIEKLATEEMRKDILKEFRRIGFLFVALDLQGYRTGSMNATIGQSREQKDG